MRRTRKPLMPDRIVAAIARWTMVAACFVGALLCAARFAKGHGPIYFVLAMLCLYALLVAWAWGLPDRLAGTDPNRR